MRGGRRALVVDEAKDGRIAISRLLKWVGFEVVQASDGASAIKMYEEDPSFDVVTLSASMSRLDSYTIAKLIRQYQVAKRPYIVGVGFSAEFNEKALRSGMDSFVVRPSPMELPFAGNVVQLMGSRRD